MAELTDYEAAKIRLAQVRKAADKAAARSRKADNSLAVVARHVLQKGGFVVGATVRRAATEHSAEWNGVVTGYAFNESRAVCQRFLRGSTRKLCQSPEYPYRAIIAPTTAKMEDWQVVAPPAGYYAFEPPRPPISSRTESYLTGGGEDAGLFADGPTAAEFEAAMDGTAEVVHAPKLIK